jgi:hypothetical protein
MEKQDLLRQIAERARSFAQAIATAEQAKQELAPLLNRLRSSDSNARDGKTAIGAEIRRIQEACGHFAHLSSVAQAKAEIGANGLEAILTKTPTQQSVESVA